MSKKTKTPTRRPWKKHKQVIVPVNCGVRIEVDKNIASLIRLLSVNGLETRHSCEGRKHMQGYVSMFSTPQALGLASYLLVNGGETKIELERSIHPKGYENLVIRWPKKNQKKLETLILKYFV